MKSNQLYSLVFHLTINYHINNILNKGGLPYRKLKTNASLWLPLITLPGISNYPVLISQFVAHNMFHWVQFLLLTKTIDLLLILFKLLIINIPVVAGYFLQTA